MLTGWVAQRWDVRGLALVGSWARGAAHGESDVELVLLTDAPSRYIEQADWSAEVGASRLARSLEWGVVTERRFALPSGLEFEVAIGSPGWACVDPVDAGTRKVVAHGMRILYDPDKLLLALAAACSNGHVGFRAPAAG